jgi:hypothetical protein
MPEANRPQLHNPEPSMGICTLHTLPHVAHVHVVGLAFLIPSTTTTKESNVPWISPSILMISWLSKAPAAVRSGCGCGGALGGTGCGGALGGNVCWSNCVVVLL